MCRAELARRRTSEVLALAVGRNSRAFHLPILNTLLSATAIFPILLYGLLNATKTTVAGVDKLLVYIHLVSPTHTLRFLYVTPNAR